MENIIILSIFIILNGISAYKNWKLSNKKITYLNLGAIIFSIGIIFRII